MKNKRKKILLCSVLTVIICLALGYIMHKNKRDSYIETQEKRIDLYFKYNLKKYDSLKIVKVEKIQWEDTLLMVTLIIIKIIISLLMPPMRIIFNLMEILVMIQKL